MKKEIQMLDARSLCNDIDDMYLEKGQVPYESLKNTYKKGDIIPCLFVVSYGSLFGKIERKIKGDHYAHAAMTFDTSLETLYTFNSPGFIIESLRTYIERNEEYEIYVGTIFLTYKEYSKVRVWLNNLLQNADKTWYPFRNLINCIFNKPVPRINQFSMICSEFVARLFNVANINLSTRDLTITTPEDLRQSKNTRVYAVYEGLAVDYNPKKTNHIIGALKSRIMRGFRNDLIGESTSDTEGKDNFYMEGFWNRDKKPESQEEKIAREFDRIFRIHKKIIPLYQELINYGSGYITEDGYCINPENFEEARQNYFVPTPEQFHKAKGGYYWDYANYLHWYYIHKLGYHPEYVKTFVIVTSNGEFRAVPILYVGNTSNIIKYLYLECDIESIRGVYAGLETPASCIAIALRDILRSNGNKAYKFKVYMHNELPSALYGADMAAYCKWVLTNKLYTNSATCSTDGVITTSSQDKGKSQNMSSPKIKKFV